MPYESMWTCYCFLVCAADFSVFVGDLAPDVTDYALQENFRHFFASVRSAKASALLCSGYMDECMPMLEHCAFGQKP